MEPLLPERCSNMACSHICSHARDFSDEITVDAELNTLRKLWEVAKSDRVGCFFAEHLSPVGFSKDCHTYCLKAEPW